MEYLLLLKISLSCCHAGETTASILGVTPDFSVVRILLSKLDTPQPLLSIHFVTQIPVGSPLVLLIPTRDTPWQGSHAIGSRDQDTLLSVSSDGCLNFWEEDDDEIGKLRCVGTVRTGDPNPLKLARCNTGKKTALGL